MGYREIKLKYYKQSLIPTDTLVHYQFNGNLVDSSPIGNNGIGTGTYTFGTDRKGNSNSAIQFTDGLITTTNNIDLSTTDKISVSLWFKTSQITAGCLFFTGSNLLTSNSLYADIGYIGLGQLMFQDRDNSLTRSLLFGNAQRNDNNWHHLVIVNDRSQSTVNQIKVYVNNILVSLSVFEINDLSVNYTNNYKVEIGKQSLGFFTGLIDDFRIYSRILTLDEINLLYKE